MTIGPPVRRPVALGSVGATDGATRDSPMKPLARSLLIAMCMLPAVPAWSATTQRWVVLVDNGKKAGEQVVTTGDDGVVRTSFVFKDNGRGPEMKEEYQLAPDGTFSRFHVTGSSTFGAKIDETYTRTGDHAEWKTTADHGARDVSGTAEYAPLAGTPQSGAATVAALAKRADGKLPLVPGGTLTMRELAREQVSNGKQTKTVRLLALTGQGLTPNFGWFTDDATPGMFAFIAPGFVQMVPEGWEAVGKQLEERQKKAEGELLVTMQKQLAQPLPGSTLIRNVRVFDSVNATLGNASDVLIRDGKIVSVTPTGEAAKADQTIDGGGRVMIPGLWDMHAHVSRWDGGLNIASGVTSVRDMGNDNDTLQQIIAEEKAGTLLMPHITPAGFIEGESPMSARNGFVIKNLDEAKKAVDWYHDHGYPQIKIYNSFPKDVLKDTVAYAHSKGMRVSGHVPAFLRAQDVIDDGFDEIQHINQLMLNFLVDDKTDTRTLERFYLPARKVADLDFDSKPVQDFIHLMATKKIASDPTLATFEFIHQRDGTMSPIVAPVADHLPPDITRGRMAAEMNIPDDATYQQFDKSYKKMVEFVGRMYKAGVPLLAGTDEMPGFTLQRELELYVQAGLTPAQVLQVATLNGATVARATDRGVIAPGKASDLVLLDGDPMNNISDVRKVALVIKGATAYSPADVDRALGIAPFADAVRVSK